MTSRAIPALAAVAALALAAAACSSSANANSGNAKDVSSVTLRIGDQKGTGAEALLTAAGLINKLPFKVTWADFTSGPPMMQAMGSGAIDIGGVGNGPVAFAAAGGEKIAVVGARKVNPLGAALLVPKNSPITSVAQLRGKRIAVAQGTSGHVHLLNVLQVNGLTIKDITPVYLQPADALSAFSTGHVDAWDVWSPYVEQAEVQYGARALATGQGYNTTYGFEVASRSALGDPAKATAIGDYLKLLNQAYTWSNSHLSAWAAVWAKASGLPDGVMLKAATDDTNDPVPIDAGVISAEQQVVNVFYTAGLIPAKVDFNDYADKDYNTTAGS